MVRRLVFVVSGVLFLFASPSFAQQGTSELRGKVTDQQNAVLPGVTVTVRNQDNGLFRETVTAADGAFHLSSMTPGMYEVTAELHRHLRGAPDFEPHVAL